MSGHEDYLIALSEQLCPISWDEGLSSLSPSEQIFVTVWELEAEINNGGFSQYYFNSAGDNAKAVVEALEAIGAPLMAGIVRLANALFPEGPPSDQDERTDLLNSLDSETEEALDGLTGEFCAYPENLSDLLHEFVQEHQDAIRGS